MAKPPLPNLRCTVSVKPDVHAVFVKLAESSGQSVSRVMGEWLADTADAAEHMTKLVQRAKTAPKKLAADLHLYAQALSGATAEVMVKMQRAEAGGPSKRRAERDGATARQAPPSSNTGGKVPREQRESNKGGGPL